jgi:hypothetical protein
MNPSLTILEGWEIANTMVSQFWGKADGALGKLISFP